MIVRAGKIEVVAPVAMLSAQVSISEETLVRFKGKHVRVIPHADEAGIKGAARWAHQLKSVGAKGRRSIPPITSHQNEFLKFTDLSCRQLSLWPTLP